MHRRAASHCGAGAAKPKPLSLCSQPPRQRAGVSVHCHPPLCRCLELAAHDGGLNCSGAAGEKVQSSKWRPAMRRGVSLCLPRRATGRLRPS
jgi:hypothetical protein